MEKNTTKLLSVLTALLLTCGCSSVPDAAPHAPPSFHADPGHAKAYFYAVYDNPEDKPSFDETFRLHVDNGYIGDIGDGQFIETDILPGNRAFDVDEIVWSGNVPTHLTVKVQAMSGKAYFIAEDIKPNGKAVLSSVDLARGEEDVMARTRQCLCQ